MLDKSCRWCKYQTNGICLILHKHIEPVESDDAYYLFEDGTIELAIKENLNFDNLPLRNLRTVLEEIKISKKKIKEIIEAVKSDLEYEENGIVYDISNAVQKVIANNSSGEEYEINDLEKMSCIYFE